jgi:ribosomal-protein-alanine N-acetyltransferase
MAFFRSVSFSETMPAIQGDGVSLRPPQSSDHAEWAALREESRAFLTPWEPVWPSDDLTRGAFRRRLKRYADDQRNDLAYAFMIFRSEDDALVGGITLANVRRGVAQAGSIGYWIGERYARKGYMTAAVRALIPFSFQTLRLHRLEAACIPSNAASVGASRKYRFHARGLCPPISLHQWDLARPSALCPDRR